MITRIIIGLKEFEENNKSVSADILNVDSAKLKSIYVDGKEMAPSSYRVEGQYIKFVEFAKPKRNIELFVDIDSKALSDEKDRRAAELDSAKLQRNTTIIVSLIGLAGIIVTGILKPEFISQIFQNDRSEKLVVVEPDQYGVDENGKFFHAVIRWGEPSEKNYVFPQSILDTYQGWYFLRVRQDLIDLKQTVAKNVKGPIPLKNGQVIEEYISNDIKRAFCENGSIQMILVALPEGKVLRDGMRISDFGKDAKILLSPADGRKTNC